MGWSCDICEQTFPLRFCLISHKLLDHRINGSRDKISRLLQGDNVEVEELLYSSESECEYRIVSKIVKVPRKLKIPSDSRYLQINCDEADNILANENSCVRCGAVFLNDDEYGAHVERTCCDIKAYDVIEPTHKKIKPVELYFCRVCNERFENEQNLRLHEKIHNIDRTERFVQIKEDVVQYDLPNEVNHPKNEPHNNEKREIFICDYCEGSYISKAGLKKHLLQTHLKAERIPSINPKKDKSNYQFDCSKCGKKMYNERYKVNHELTCFTHLCSYCGKHFKNSRNLSVHIMSHTKERPYECKLCDKAFLIKRSLKDHMNKHEGVKPYKCPFENCEKSFTLNTGVRQHINVMHREKRFSCKYCQQQYSTKFHMECHVRTHTGEKPYKCTDCPASFRLPSTYRKHKRVHTGERPYSCDVCLKGFISSYNLKQHKKSQRICKPPLEQFRVAAAFPTSDKHSNINL